MTRRSLAERPEAIARCLVEVEKHLAQQIAELDRRKPNDPAALATWQDWMTFLAELREALDRLAAAVDATMQEAGVAKEEAEKVQSALDVYKQKIANWPVANAEEVVDGSCRFGLVAICATIEMIFGQPLAGGAIGAAIFGGPRIGKAVGEAMRSGGGPS